MLVESPAESRSLRLQTIDCDLAVVGGGMAGVCCAITAARAGLHVVLIQDRPVLGGNASSEVRLWIVGATVHMYTNNRWAREGGVFNEILMENLWRNPEGNAVIFDALLLDKARAEANLTLLLNAACYEVKKSAAQPDRIAGLKAFSSQNSTLYAVNAPLFCDASGDGIVGFLAGAAFRVGAESQAEFGEGFAPTGEFGYLLGHSIFFYSKDLGRPVQFVAPSFAHREIPSKIPRFKRFNTKEQGSRLWWIEWGGRLDTVHDTELIKWELWRVVYGVWDYIKNSGNFPEAANLTLEWVGNIPGKRESRRFEGDYILTQNDVVERRLHADDVAFGGWSIDLHPADGVFSDIAGSRHLHSKGIYPIPYRCYYSRNIENLFLAGRIISASHVAFGSARVIATCALGGQAVGQAAVLCKKHGLDPRAIGAPEHMRELQTALLRAGHFVPAVEARDPQDLAQAASVQASSSFTLDCLPDDGPPIHLERAMAQMLPLAAGPVPVFGFIADVEKSASLEVALWTTSDGTHHTPDVLLARQTLPLEPGPAQPLRLKFPVDLPAAGYVFICFGENRAVALHTSSLRVTGVLRSVFGRIEDNTAFGGEKYQIYHPERRPGGANFAVQAQPEIDLFSPGNVLTSWQRPTTAPNAWVAAAADGTPWLRLAWPAPQTISTIEIAFDGDFEHPMESVLWGHPERAVIFCVKRYELLDDQENVLAHVDDNHQSLVCHRLPAPVATRQLTLRILETWGAPAAVFAFRCYSN